MLKECQKHVKVISIRDIEKTKQNFL